MLKLDKIDIELIAQDNRMDLLKEGLKNKLITIYTADELGRNLICQCAIFGNLEMMKFLVKQWGVSCLKISDKFNTTLAHFAVRSGYVEILQYLQENWISANEKEDRFQLTPLTIAVAMKHQNCIDVLIPHVNKSSLNFALLSSCYEGRLSLVKQLIENGADIEARVVDSGATPIDQA